MAWWRAPLPLTAIERRLTRVSERVWPWLRVALALCGVAAVGAGAWWWTWLHAPVLAPRDRPEALCFALAQAPAFDPPMHVETGAAMVRGRFSADTPPELAIRAAMHVGDDMVVSQRKQHVGDYDVAVMWLRLPTEGGGHHWLVVGWMEDSDLAMCSFRFAGEPSELTADQSLWGHRLTDRILQPEYFQSDRVPDVRWRVSGRDPLPSFGPPAKD
jgi:hypothetical protein